MAAQHAARLQRHGSHRLARHVCAGRDGNVHTASKGVLGLRLAFRRPGSRRCDWLQLPVQGTSILLEPLWRVSAEKEASFGQDSSERLRFRPSLKLTLAQYLIVTPNNITVSSVVVCVLPLSRFWRTFKVRSAHTLLQVRLLSRSFRT